SAPSVGTTRARVARATRVHESRALARLPDVSRPPAMRPRRILAAAVLVFAVWTVAVAALRVPPPPDHRINDYARALPASERNRLEQKLIDRERGSSTQIVVAIFPSLEGESLEDFSIRLPQAWRIGPRA